MISRKSCSAVRRPGTGSVGNRCILSLENVETSNPNHPKHALINIENMFLSTLGTRWSTRLTLETHYIDKRKTTSESRPMAFIGSQCDKITGTHIILMILMCIWYCFSIVLMEFTPPKFNTAPWKVTFPIGKAGLSSNHHFSGSMLKFPGVSL